MKIAPQGAITLLLSKGWVGWDSDVHFTETLKSSLPGDLVF